MPELLTYLHGSELVVRFQRRCGLYLLEAEHHSCARSCSPTANGHAGPRGVKQLEDRHNIQDNKHNNNQYKENGGGTPVSGSFFPFYCKQTKLDHLLNSHGREVF